MTAEEPQLDIFDALLIVTMRNYDLLAVIARALNPVETDKILNLHDDYKLFSAPPGFTTLGDEDGNLS